MSARAPVGRAARSGGAGQGVGERAALLTPIMLLVLGAIGGGVASIFAAPIGVAALALAVGAAAMFWIRRGAVRRVSRWTMAAGTAVIVGIPGAGFVASAGIAAARFDPWTALWAGLAYAATAGVLWDRALRRREREWEASRKANERQVLDQVAATFDVERGFQFGGATPAGTWQRWLERAAPFVVPIVISLFAGSGRRGWGDAREVVLLVLGPVALLLWLPVVAQGVVTVRKLREYERALGREVVNR